MLCASDRAFASGRLYYGCHSVSGLDTDMRSFERNIPGKMQSRTCREYVLKVSAKCISDELAIPMNDQITGNCTTGEFSDSFGTKYQFLGILKPNDNNLAKYAIKNLTTGEIAYETTEDILDAAAQLVGFSVQAERLLAVGLV